MSHDHQMAQHFVQCQLCTNNVQFLCKPCNIKLCENCVGGHLQNKTPEAHQFIHYHKFRGQKSVMDDPEVVAVITCPYNNMLDIARQGDSYFYVCSSLSRHISKHDFKQNLAIDSKLAAFWPQRLAHVGNTILYTERNNNVVNRVTDKGETQILFSTGDWNAHGIACTASGNILLGLHKIKVGKLAVFDMKGNVVKEVESNNGNPLYTNPYYVTENTNGDLCAADIVLASVIVVDSTGLFRFSYTGNPSIAKGFDPHGVAADSQSNLVVADWATRKLHLINETGNFLRYLDFFVNEYMAEMPTGVCIDPDDLLFVCGHDSVKVKVMKYLQ
ncbi:tripartite motif-containing protein 2-like [Saccostrea cucullata]|uniref:tripartite motif-containing protein 2-like n=1 Tax=Saccostrea cuccullata TaxID=36930 RepID=UPI002ED46194